MEKGVRGNSVRGGGGSITSLQTISISLQNSLS